MKSKVKVALIAMLVTGCATDRVQDKTNLNLLGTTAAKCIVDAAKVLDDGISPADTVAIGVMSKCQNEIDAYDNVRLPAGAGYNVYATTVWNNRHTGWSRQITSIVLESRAAKKSK